VPTVYAKFHVDRFIVLLLAKTAEFSRVFNFNIVCECVVAPTSGAETQMNTGAQLQTFPYKAASKLFLYSNALMAILRSQTLALEKYDGQTKTITKVSCPSAKGELSPSPIVLGTVIEGPQIMFAPWKCFCIRRILWPLEGTENLGQNAPQL